MDLSRETTRGPETARMTSRLDNKADPAKRSSAPPIPGWSDRRLINACLDGNELAWHALVDRYSQLVYSMARRYGASTDEANDLFQAIWLDAYNDLPKLRKKSSFKAWLTSVAKHKAYHWKRQHLAKISKEIPETDDERLEHRPGQDPDLDERLANEQLVREAIRSLSERCRKMIQLLFFTFPPKPYKEIAEQLGLATGSIGFIRGRCLKRLQALIERRSLR